MRTAILSMLTLNLIMMCTQECKPKRISLDHRGPQPVVGIGTSLLLWASEYVCSLCLSNTHMHGKKSTTGKHKFKSTSLAALRALPEYIRHTLESDVYVPGLHSGDDEGERVDGTTTSSRGASRNRLLLSKS